MIPLIVLVLRCLFDQVSGFVFPPLNNILKYCSKMNFFSLEFGVASLSSSLAPHLLKSLVCDQELLIFFCIEHAQKS